MHKRKINELTILFVVVWTCLHRKLLPNVAKFDLSLFGMTWRACCVTHWIDQCQWWINLNIGNSLLTLTFPMASIHNESLDIFKTSYRDMTVAIDFTRELVTGAMYFLVWDRNNIQVHKRIGRTLCAHMR
jgi:hypothetical protein